MDTLTYACHSLLHVLLKFDYKVVPLISNIFPRNITNGGEIPKLSSFPNVFDTYVAEIQYICKSQRENDTVECIAFKIWQVYLSLYFTNLL